MLENAALAVLLDSKHIFFKALFLCFPSKKMGLRKEMLVCLLV